MVASVFVFVPIQAEKKFGPASSELSPALHLYLSTLLLYQSSDLLRPVDPAGIEQSFIIEFGETTPAISRRLDDQGLLRNSETFRNYLVYSGMDTSIQAGTYRLSPGMTSLQVARRLQDRLLQM